MVMSMTCETILCLEMTPTARFRTKIPWRFLYNYSDFAKGLMFCVVELINRHDRISETCIDTREVNTRCFVFELRLRQAIARLWLVSVAFHMLQHHRWRPFEPRSGMPRLVEACSQWSWEYIQSGSLFPSW